MRIFGASVFTGDEMRLDYSAAAQCAAGPGFLWARRLVGIGLAGVFLAGPAHANMDALATEQAAAACAARDLPGLFNAMMVSEPALRQYVAEKIALSDADGARQIAGADYTSPPIAMLDYVYVTRASLEAREKDPAAALTYLQVEFNQSQDDRWRVDWAELSGPILEGEDVEVQPEPVGRSGYLLFFPTATCWEMVQDHVDVSS